MTGRARTLAIGGTLLGLLALAAAPAAQAGTVYISLPETHVGAARYQAQISVTNTLDVPLQMDTLLLPAGTDGTVRDDLERGRFTIEAGKTFLFRPGAPARGLLELSGPDGLTYSARLVAADGARIELPVVTSQNLTAADETLVVQGLRGAPAQRAELMVINLGETATSCTVSLLRTDGSQVAAPRTIALMPLAQAGLPDLFGGRTVGEIDARAEVSCGNDFYAFVQTAEASTGRLALTTPAPSSSLLLAPDYLKATGNACSSGSTVCSEAGVVHVSSKAKPVRTLIMTPPAGTYRAVRAHVEIVVPGWNNVNPRGAHGVMYLAINKNKDLLGSLFLRGPGSHTVTQRHGMHNNATQKSKLMKPLQAQLNSRYVFDYDYNAGAGTATLKVTHQGRVVAVLQDRTNVRQFQIGPRDKVLIGLSNPHVKSKEEPASLGWRYSNVRVEFFK